MKLFCVYILSSKRNDTLYVGVTSNIVQRVYEHKHKAYSGFTQKYNVTQLVYYEICKDAMTAFTRETQLKKWKRQWKLELIEKQNPEWKDLYETFNN